MLLLVLASVVSGTYYQSHLTADWDSPLLLTLYPINADNRRQTRQYIDLLTANDFKVIGDFMQEEAHAFGRPTLSDFRIELAPQLTSHPPTPPPHAAGRLAIAHWSLSLRHWVYRQTGSFGLDRRHIRIFVLYQQGQEGQALAHSYGLQKGLVGVVHAFALDRQRDQNKVVIVHELLHTFGATDKYDRNGFPLYPQGYAEPNRDPLLPQEFAEIMAGRMAISDDEIRTPESLDQAVIGPATAREINW